MLAGALGLVVFLSLSLCFAAIDRNYKRRDDGKSAA